VCSNGNGFPSIFQRAEELRLEKEARALKFARGKIAYERGQYPVSAALLESAVNEEGPFTLLGGEIQLWLGKNYLSRSLPLFFVL
jgi:hypothetical protein